MTYKCECDYCGHEQEFYLSDIGEFGLNFEQSCSKCGQHICRSCADRQGHCYECAEREIAISFVKKGSAYAGAD